MNWHAFTREPNQLGESPFWHPGEGRLYRGAIGDGARWTAEGH